MPPPELLLKPLDQLPDPLPLPTLGQGRGRSPIFSARIRPPGSKSLTNRALLLAGLAEGASDIRGALLDADDTNRMIGALSDLGVVMFQSDDLLQLGGCGGRWEPMDVNDPEIRLDLGNAGTAVRFLAAAALLSPKPILIDGNERMRQRPIGELVDALQQLGATIEYRGRPGCPPLRIQSPADKTQGAHVELGETASSQFISALLLIAPFWPGGMTLMLSGEITSRSYVSMTLGLLDALGAHVRMSDDLSVIRISGGGLKGFDYTVEPDASSATYFWAAAALIPGAVCRIEDLDARSLQGDAAFPDLLARMGAAVLREDSPVPSIGIRGPAQLEPIMADMTQMPDAAMTLAAVACFANGRSVIRGLKTLRVKESDRIAALQTELAKIGIAVDVSVLGDPDALTITPPAGGLDTSPSCPPVEFETYDDHRMAMALSLIALRRPNIAIRNPRCVAKTYPGYWADFAKLY